MMLVSFESSYSSSQPVSPPTVAGAYTALDAEFREFEEGVASDD